MTLIKRFVKPSEPAGGHLSTLAELKHRTVQSTKIDLQAALCLILYREVKNHTCVYDCFARATEMNA
jgi:hypothetical protein